MEFKDKVVIITGGSKGIGKALVDSFVSNQAKVYVVDKSEGLFDPSVSFFKGDLSLKEELDQFIKYFLEQEKQLDILINNACQSHKGLLSECSYDDFLDTLKGGLVAPYYLVLKLKEKFNTQSSIINISSTRSFMSQADTESYSSTKGGLSALTHALSISLAPKVRVNSISPGWIDTTNSDFESSDHYQHPVGRVGRPEDIVEMVNYLCSEKAGFITGQDFVVDGGMSKQMIYHNDKGWSYHN